MHRKHLTSCPTASYLVPGSPALETAVAALISIPLKLEQKVGACCAVDLVHVLSQLPQLSVASLGDQSQDLAVRLNLRFDYLDRVSALAYLG